MRWSWLSLVLIPAAASAQRPTYLRIGRGEPPRSYAVPEYAPWRQLTSGSGPVVITVGPLAGTYIEAFSQLPQAYRPNLWVVTELPLERNPLPVQLLEQIVLSGDLHVAEEHVRRGSFGAELALHFLELGVAVKRFQHHHARAHHFERYGSQNFLRQLSALDPASLVTALSKS